MEGESTLENRRDTVYQQRDNVKKEIKKLQSTLDILNFKCQFYDEAVRNLKNE